MIGFMLSLRSGGGSGGGPAASIAGSACPGALLGAVSPPHRRRWGGAGAMGRGQRGHERQSSRKRGTRMTGLGQSPRTRQRRSRIVMALLAGLLVALGAAGAIAQVGKSSLIGKLEGPEVVTDAGKWPKSFKEAPQLAELVKAGKLPPVAERIGQDPLVIKPLKEIGKYGGTWRAGIIWPDDFLNWMRCCSLPEH